MFLNVFYSWLIAQVLHPVVYIVALWAISGYFGMSAAAVADIFYFFAFGLIVSLPSLLLGWLCMGLIVHSSYTTLAKFLLWIVATAILVILNFWIIILFIDRGFQFQDFIIAIPGIISIWIASIIRYKQFQKLNITENNLSESEMSFEVNSETINH